MHKKLFEKFHNLNDPEWIDLIFKSVDYHIIDGCQFPGFPEENIQIGMIGSSGKNALYEPKYMYQEIKRISLKQCKTFDKLTTLLDFACGYGRNVRFFMKDIYPGNLYASDVRTDLIDICRSTFSCSETGNTEVIFDQNDPFPQLEYKEETFDIIIAYSLFSHFSEHAHLAWLKEFYRILKTAGLLFLTIRQQSFLTNLEKTSKECKTLPMYNKMLVEKLGDKSIQKRFKKGDYIFNPSGGGHELTTDFYGDTVIPDKYIYKNWKKWFDIVEHYDDPSRLPQAFICLQKKTF
jgi:ubiquinone/menaquinone biosynthesis C-methylase UbiE